MSYSFSWDCTLPITNIQDIISINIVPETRTFDEGNYLSLKGEIAIDGEYFDMMDVRRDFSENIPMDIILPNNGQRGAISTEVTNFDYEVKGGKILFLKVDLVLNGYEINPSAVLQPEAASNYGRTLEDMDPLEIHETVLESTEDESLLDPGRHEHKMVKKVMEKAAPLVKEAVIAKVEEKVKPIIEQVKEQVMPSVPVEAAVEEPSVEMAELPVNPVEVPAVEMDVQPDDFGDYTQYEHPQQPVQMASVPAPVIQTPVATPVAQVPAAVMPEAVQPVPAPALEPETCEEEEMLPFNFKKAEIPVVQEMPPVSQPVKSNIFDMLSHLDVEYAPEPVVEEETAETADCHPCGEIPVIEPPQEKQFKPSNFSFGGESVAKQFSDGASVVKVLFVTSEMSIAHFCDQHAIAPNHIFNLEELEDELKCGDRVVVKYGRVH